MNKLNYLRTQYNVNVCNLYSWGFKKMRNILKTLYLPTLV